MPNKEAVKLAVKRWEAQYEAMQERMTRQKLAINRLLSANTIATEALMEIAERDLGPKVAATRARRALQESQEFLAAAKAEIEEG